MLELSCVSVASLMRNRSELLYLQRESPELYLITVVLTIGLSCKTWKKKKHFPIWKGPLFSHFESSLLVAWTNTPKILGYNFLLLEVIAVGKCESFKSWRSVLPSDCRWREWSLLLLSTNSSSFQSMHHILQEQWQNMICKTPLILAKRHKRMKPPFTSPVSRNASLLLNQRNIFLSPTLLDSFQYFTSVAKGCDHLQNTGARPSLDDASVNELVPFAAQSHGQMSLIQPSCVSWIQKRLNCCYVLVCSSDTVE